MIQHRVTYIYTLIVVPRVSGPKTTDFAVAQWFRFNGSRSRHVQRLEKIISF